MNARAAALGAAAGALYWLGLPGHLGWACAVLAFAPLAVAARAGVPGGASAGLAMGVVSSAAGMSFVPVALVTRAGVSVPLAVLAYASIVVTTSAPFAALGAGAAWLSRRGAPLALAVGSLHAILEAHAPRLLSWSLAASLVDAPLVAPTLHVVGARLVGAAAATLGACVGVAIAARSPRSLWLPMAAAGCVWLSTRAAPAVDEGPALVVAAVQPGRFEGPADAREQLRWARHGALSREAAARGAELIVGAEGVVPGVVSAEVATTAGEPLASTSVVGAVLDDGGVIHNAAIAIEAGRAVGRHDKRHLVPLSERAPRWLSGWLGRPSLSPGDGSGALETRAGRLGVGICYEELVDGAFDGAVLDGAELLVTLSHDEWFDGTDVPDRQLAHARLRALESRRWLVRASTSGPSVIIDPSGAVRASAPRGESTLALATARRRSGAPLAARLGAVWLAAPWVVLVLCSAAGEYRRRRPVQGIGRRAEKLTVREPRGTHSSRFREGAVPGEASGGRP